MKTQLFASLLATALFASADPCKAQLRTSLDKLAWMAGCWIIQDGETVTEQHWKQPAGLAMLGINRTVENRRTIFFEQLQIEQRDTVVVYTATPRQRNPTEFVLVDLSDKWVVFENLANDFPQRISYEMETDGVLTVFLEGREGEKVKTQSYQMRRGKCN